MSDVARELFVLGRALQRTGQAIEDLLEEERDAGELRALVTENDDGSVTVSFVAGNRVVELDHILAAGGLAIGAFDREQRLLRNVRLEFTAIPVAEIVKPKKDG